MMTIKTDEQQLKKDAIIMGHRLLMLRTAYNLSQEEFGNRIGYHQRFISEWELGKKIISIKALLAIAREFNVSLLYFDPTRSETQLEQVRIQTLAPSSDAAP